MKTVNVMTQRIINELSYRVVGCAIEVHKHLGPGLLESIYESCLIYELRAKGFDVKSQVPVPISYKSCKLEGHLVLDILVNGMIIVELKAVEQIIPVYKAQLLSYLKLTGKPKGLLINFNCENIVNQMVPMVTEIFRQLPIE